MPGVVTSTKTCGDATSDMVGTCRSTSTRSGLSARDILSFVGEHVRYAPNRVMFYSPNAAKGTPREQQYPILNAPFQLT
jgi:hypothetical protein